MDFISAYDSRQSSRPGVVQQERLRSKLALLRRLRPRKGASPLPGKHIKKSKQSKRGKPEEAFQNGQRTARADASSLVSWTAGGMDLSATTPDFSLDAPPLLLVRKSNNSRSLAKQVNPFIICDYLSVLAGFAVPWPRQLPGSKRGCENRRVCVTLWWPSPHDLYPVWPPTPSPWVGSNERAHTQMHRQTRTGEGN